MKHLYSYFLFLIVCSVGYTFGQCPLDIDETAVAPTNNLLLHLALDGDLSNLGSGNYTITNNGAQFVGSNCGQGLYFDGNNDFVNISPSMDLVNDFTVCAWINPSSQGNPMGIFSIREQCTSTYRGYSILQFNIGDYNIPTLNNQLNIHQNCTGYSAGDRYTNTGILIPNNQETFVALTVQNNSSENRVVKLYVNCTEYSTTMTLDYPTAVCFNGNQNYTTTFGASSGVTNHTSTFHGTIDQLRVYDVTLNHEQILDVYQSCLPLQMDVVEYPDCNGDSAQITLNNTEQDVFYQLINTTTSTPIGNPIPGNCGSLIFNTGIYSSPTQFEIEATHSVSACSITLDSTITLSPSGSGFVGTENFTICSGDSIPYSGGFITSAGTYIDTIPLASGCDSIITLNVTEAPPFNLDLGPDFTLCGNATETITLAASLPSYLWQDGSTSSSYQINQSGTYWVEATDACGIVHHDTILVTSVNSPIDLGPDTTICAGTSITLDASSSGGPYLWQDNSVNSTFNANVSGTYWVEVQVNSCVFRDTLELSVISPPDFSLGEDLVICEGDQHFLTVSNTEGVFSWNTGSQESSYIVTQPGLYSVSVVNICGQASDEILIETTGCSCEVYIPNSFTPHDGKFNNTFGPVQECDLESYLFKIYNRWGEVIFESRNPLEQWDGTYLGRNVTTGTYTYILEYELEEEDPIYIEGHVNLIK